MSFSWLSVNSQGFIVDANGKIVRLRGFNTAGIEYGNGSAVYSQAFINAMKAAFPGMNLWRLALNSEWWNLNLSVPGTGMNYQTWVQQLITWMKAAGCYVEVDTVTWCQIAPQGGTQCDNLWNFPSPYTFAEVDTFSRANQSGWGGASNGDTWTTITTNGVGGNNPTLSIVNHEGVGTGQFGTNSMIQLGSASGSDQQVLVRMALTTASSMFAGVALKITNTGSCYQAYINHSHIFLDKYVNGVFVSTIGNLTGQNFEVTTGATFYWLLYQITGSTHNIKVWQDGTTQPSSWNLTVTDNAIASGSMGLYYYASASGDQVAYDSFTAGFPTTACSISQTTQNNPPFTEAQAKTSFQSFWTSFVPLYQNDPAILYDALNEPGNGGIFSNDVSTATNTMINYIQGLQSKALIFVNDDPANYSQSNLVITDHLYDDIPGNNRWWNKLRKQRYVFTTIPRSQAKGYGWALEEWNVGASDSGGTDNSHAAYAREAAKLCREGYPVIYYHAGNVMNSDLSLTAEGRIVQRAFRDIDYKPLAAVRRKFR